MKIIFTANHCIIVKSFPWGDLDGFVCFGNLRVTIGDLELHTILAATKLKSVLNGENNNINSSNRLMSVTKG